MNMTESLPNLPPAVARHTFHILISSLPPLVTDTPEERADREEAAIAAVAALYPADAFEARLAAHIVSADAQAMDSLRLAAEAQNADEVRRCRAQAACMMRLMQSGLRQLRRDQAAREKAEREMHPETMQRAGWWFRDASVPAPDEPPAEAAPEPDIAAEAELYAALHPKRAALIRSSGGLPAKLDFGPPEPELVDAIVHGTTPNLLALDAAGA